MQFSVASWHTRSVDYWLQHNAYTTMASPPPWAREKQRNLRLFAPPASIVFGTMPQTGYIKIYRWIMQQRLPAVRQWVADHDQEHVMLLCACPDGQFCHRLLVAKLLVWLGSQQLPVPEEH